MTDKPIKMKKTTVARKPGEQNAPQFIHDNIDKWWRSKRERYTVKMVREPVEKKSDD